MLLPYSLTYPEATMKTLLIFIALLLFMELIGPICVYGDQGKGPLEFDAFTWNNHCTINFTR